MKILILSFITLMLVSCSTSKVQKNSELEEFDESKFLGKWYEIGRIDYFFQKNIINSIAEYSLNENGTIKVINKGYNIKKDKEVTAEGHAVIKGKGRLKVYFNPFFGYK